MTAALLATVTSALMVPPPLDAVAAGYGFALAAHPLVTKAATNAAISGLGDALAQQCRSDGAFNAGRTKNYVLLGLGSGVAWSGWYEGCDAAVGKMMAQAGDSLLGSTHLECAARTALSILGEQFIFAPLIFGLWVVPAGTILNGGRLADVSGGFQLGPLAKLSKPFTAIFITHNPPPRTRTRRPGEVQSKLPEMLLLQAKVWTLANIVIYNSPLPVRLLASNTVDLIWSSLLSRVVADLGGESCAAPASALGPAVPARLARPRPEGGTVRRVLA